MYGDDLISLSGKRRDWEGLKRKISRGIPLDEAAAQCGIPIGEVFQYVSSRMAQVDTLNFELRLIGQGAIKNALTKLTELAQDGAREGKDFESTDLEAAKTLAKFGIDALKLARAGLAPPKGDEPEKTDLFDAAANPWKLKQVE